MSGSHVAYLLRVYERSGAGCDRDAFDVRDALLRFWMEFCVERRAQCAESRGRTWLKVGPRLVDHVRQEVETYLSFFVRAASSEMILC